MSKSSQSLSIIGIIQVTYFLSIYLNFYGWVAEQTLRHLDIPSGDLKDGNVFILAMIFLIFSSIFTGLFGLHLTKDLPHRRLVIAQLLFFMVAANLGGFIVCYSC